MVDVDKKREARYAFGRFVVKHRVVILIAAILLVIPSAIGMKMTHINYDLLTYLPANMETVQGQNILLDDFGKGAFSFIVCEGMSDKDVAALKAQIEQVDHVDTVLWSDKLTDMGIPKQAIPEKYYRYFNSDSDDATMMAVFFDGSTSADTTLNAVTQIRQLSDQQVFVSGLSAMVDDLKQVAEQEEPVYVAVAVLGAVIALLALTDSWLVPFIFLASIGIAIMWNMGTNYFLGEISYITKALAAVLQLAVTMDYSIFLWHAFTEQREKYPGDNNTAMSVAIGETLTAIVSSALTATAGFLALCFMSYTLGADLGVVMAKGCLLGLLGSVTTLPALILLFEKALEKTRHRTLIPKADRLSNSVTKHYWIYLVIFVAVLIPAVIGFANKPLLYDFSKIIGGDSGSSQFAFVQANHKVEDDFNVATTEMILCDSNLSHADAKSMLDQIEALDGVQYAVGYDTIVGGGIPSQMIPQSAKDALKNGDHQLILVNSSFSVSSDAANNQIDQINGIIKGFDPNAMLIGEAPATKDLINTTDTDFRVVDWIAIISIAVILLIVFRSISLPVVLVFVIEFAIMINLGIPYFQNAPMVFLAPVCISTIQLGSTVNYAILMTTRYRKERYDGNEKKTAVSIALSTSLPSIVTSAVSFFAATIGVSLYSNMSIISSLCTLMARGAIISMFSVLFVLPAFFMLLDGIIIRTSKYFRPKGTSLKDAAKNIGTGTTAKSLNQTEVTA